MQVGDSIRVTFKNLASRPYTMHPHGVQYAQEMEGALHQYDSGLGAGVGTGQTFTYEVRLPWCQQCAQTLCNVSTCTCVDTA